MISAVLAGTLYPSPAISSSTNSVIIGSSGQISISAITAASGYWQDIQVAVNEAATYGIANVYIPEGTFDFVNVSEDWTGARVVISAGVNLFGAPTERDANDQVVEWKTVLVMPWDVPTGRTWFRIIGTSDPNKPSRFSDIKLVGYRTFDETSTSMHTGLYAGGGNEGGVINFRVDHCYFLNTAGGGVYAHGSAAQYGPDTICGVVDHCKFVNTAGVPAPYDSRTVSYGVYVSRGGGWGFDNEPWEDDISEVLGNYTDYTVFVENCHFEKWRHCVVSRNGAHVVLRYSTIQYDFGYGSIDLHGDYSGRALEVYNCTLSDVITPPAQKDAIWQRGGGGVIFNNTVTDYTKFTCLTRENPSEEYWPHDIWVWNNSLPTGVPPVTSDGPVEDVDYFLHAPHTFNYQPYPYPHPLTLKP